MECSPPVATVLMSSFPSRIMVLFSRLEHFSASSKASIQHRPGDTFSLIKTHSLGAFTQQYFSHFSSDIVTFPPPFQSLLESRYFRGRKRFLCLIGWADCKPRPVKLPKGFVKPPFYLLALTLLALAQRTNGERLTYGNIK